MNYNRDPNLEGAVFTGITVGVYFPGILLDPQSWIFYTVIFIIMGTIIWTWDWTPIEQVYDFDEDGYIDFDNGEEYYEEE